MKRLAMVFGILLAILSLNSCINSSSPDNATVIQVPQGTEQDFNVTTSGISTTTWDLDGVQVETGLTYSFFGDQLGNYTLIVTNGPDSVTWNIEVTEPPVTFYKDADNDGYGNPNDTVLATEQPTGYVANGDDCDDTNPDITPDITTPVPGGFYCKDGIVTPYPDDTVPPAVQASDISSGLTSVNISWTPVKGATHYNVFMAVEASDGPYKPIASNITGTSYVYVENWQDILDEVGDTPRLPPGATQADKDAFAIELTAYRINITPLIHAFKKEKGFKVQACNGSVCGELSDYDLGQAEFIHTAEESDIVQVMTNIVGDPLLACLADAPPGIDALQWPGLTIPGPNGGGEVHGFIDKSEGVYVHIIYDNFINGYLPSRQFICNGEIGKLQDLGEAAVGIIRVQGKVFLTGAIDAEVTLKSFISGSSDTPNTGTIWVLYKGQKYSFPLPV